MAVPIDPKAAQQGYLFRVERDALSIHARGRDVEAASVRIPTGVNEPGTFVFPSSSLRDLARLKQPVMFEVLGDGDVRYADADGHGFQWQPGRARGIVIPSQDSPGRDVGSAPGGLLGVALGMAVRFVRVARSGGPPASIRWTLTNDASFGFAVAATTGVHRFQFSVGRQEPSWAADLRPSLAQVLSRFVRPLGDVVRVVQSGRRATVEDRGGGWYQFLHWPSPAPVARLGDPITISARTNGEAAARSVSHLVREGHAVVALRVNSLRGVVQLGVRQPAARLVGEHPLESDMDAKDVAGVDIESRALRALLAGVGPGDVTVRLRGQHKPASLVEVDVDELRELHVSGRATRPKDHADERYACSIVRTTQVRPGDHGAVVRPR
jgi:hypothetical protein